MAELSKKPMSLKTPAIEGIVLPNFDKAFECIRITNKQLFEFADTTRSLAKAYSNIAVQLQGTMRELAKSQQHIAEMLSDLCRKVASEQIDLIIRSIRIPDLSQLIFPVQNIQLQPAQIFIQPTSSYIPPKALPIPRRKQNLQLTAVNIEGSGFVINGEYIRGMTRDSKPGKLFELMIHKDMNGVISDDLISEVVDINAGDYRAWGFVLRDLKEILLGNKLTIDLKRYRAIGKYRVKAITQYIRKPRKNKKIAKTMESN
ncbi:MAG: hypothetical protein Q8P29_01135 [Candidatus Levybacteria bacterium]|nr:hypothetical protein [Candidatus Levybacteria bacterium]